ncbi:rCG55152, isoform CRA_b [Rattus norvegicus]|uniref:RCG55152, isoform CRA_b n=1 Tax=Rattus norvegicus TaxID=10116 RepID=A6IIW7_RAT|nr:rCG55152, isoform CRA_b [Rattus norvegicus]
MAALTDVQRLQSRVEELERWVYGPGGTRGSRKVADGLVKPFLSMLPACSAWLRSTSNSRTSVWRSLRSPRLSWRSITRLQCFSPSSLCSGTSYSAS